MRYPNVSVLCLFISASSLVSLSTAQKETEVFVWSSTGGGWRAMFACIGYSNLFRQAGLFEDQDEGRTSSRFAQIVSCCGVCLLSFVLFKVLTHKRLFTQLLHANTLLLSSTLGYNQWGQLV